MKITIGNGKLEKINSLNTNPLLNEFCLRMSKQKGSICAKCYSIRTMRRWKSCRLAISRNNAILSESKLYNDEIPIINALYFRFSSHGELINELHYFNLRKICFKNPKTIFALWTKRIDIIKQYSKPDNLVLVFSEPIINNLVHYIPKGFDKRYTVFTKDYAVKKRININCNMKCIRCLRCYDTENNIWFVNELIK